MANQPSQGSLLDLKAITDEHVNRFAAEGRAPVKGAKRNVRLNTNQFDKPSPGLVKRLAHEARNEGKRSFVGDELSKSTRANLEAKALKYEAISRGDFSGLTERELAEVVVDFEGKRHADSDASSDEGEEHVDEFGRTRAGKGPSSSVTKPPPVTGAYEEVLQAKVIHGDQYLFPVYDPDSDDLRARLKAVDDDKRPDHYDASKDVRTRGAAQYQFSQNQEERARQMAELKNARTETETARAAMSSAQAARKRKLDERRALVDAKRSKLLGGDEEVQRRKTVLRGEAAEALLRELDETIQRDGS